MTAYNASEYHLHAEIPDLGSNGVGGAAAGQVYIPVPRAGTIVEVRSIINEALITANATMVVKSGTTTIGSFTITESGSAAGDIDSLGLGKDVKKDSYILIQSNGGPGGTPVCGLTVTIRR